MKRSAFIKPDENLVEAVWGGSFIERLKGLPPSGRRIGESWECSGHPEHPSVVTLSDSSRVPLTDYLRGWEEQVLGAEVARDYGDRLSVLVKFIDAREDLSVQVHPSDGQAKELGESDSGKEEAWYILEAEDGAVIRLGFRETVSREQFRADLSSPGTDVAGKYLNAVPVTKGDVFLVPTGTVHSIGRGVVLVEVEQMSSITYRVWDWNRLPRRPLHIEKAMQVLDFEAGPVDAFRRTPERIDDNEEVLVETPHFTMHRLTLRPGTAVRAGTRGGFQILTCIEGSASFEEGDGPEQLRRGQSLLVPASMGSYTITTGEGATLLKSFAGSPGTLPTR